MGHKFLPLIKDCHDVVGILVSDPIMGSGLEESLNLFQVFTFFQQSYSVVFTPEIGLKQDSVRLGSGTWASCTTWLNLSMLELSTTVPYV